MILGPWVERIGFSGVLLGRSVKRGRTLNVTATVDEVAKQLICSTAAARRSL